MRENMVYGLEQAVLETGDAQAAIDDYLREHNQNIEKTDLVADFLKYIAEEYGTLFEVLRANIEHTYSSIYFIIIITISIIILIGIIKIKLNGKNENNPKNFLKNLELISSKTVFNNKIFKIIPTNENIIDIVIIVMFILILLN